MDWFLLNMFFYLSLARKTSMISTATVGDGVCDLVQQFRVLSFLGNVIPVLKWLPKYSLRNDLVGDVTAGITVAVMHIPQGMTRELHFYVDQIKLLLLSIFRNGIRSIGWSIAQRRPLHGIFPHTRLFRFRHISTHIGWYALRCQCNDFANCAKLC